jgi:hypothetical protein
MTTPWWTSPLGLVNDDASRQRSQSFRALGDNIAILPFASAQAA